jgi:hypothetical protein
MEPYQAILRAIAKDRDARSKQADRTGAPAAAYELTHPLEKQEPQPTPAERLAAEPEWTGPDLPNEEPPTIYIESKSQ